MSGEVVMVKERAIIRIIARFPAVVKRIPCNLVINKRINIEHFTYPIVCHIYIGICIINEGNHLSHNVIPSCLHFRRKWKHRSGFVHDAIFAQIGEDYKRPCDTLPPGQAAEQFVLLSSEICVAVDVTFNVELFLFVNIVDFAGSIIHQLQQESIILQSISAGVGVTLHLMNFSTVTTIHEICANGKCLCH